MLAPSGARALDLIDFIPDRFSRTWVSYSSLGRDLPYFFDIPSALEQARQDTNTPYASWVALALQNYASRDYALASECLRGAVAATNAPPANLRHLLAKSLALQWSSEEAREQWAALAQSDPRDIEAWWQWGFQCLLLRDQSGAEKCFRHLLAIAPDEPAIHHMLAMVFWMQGNTSLAERQLIQTTRRPGALPLSALALAAMQALQDADPEAIGWLRHALRNLPSGQRSRWLQHEAFAGVKTRRPDLWQGLTGEFLLAGQTEGPEVAQAGGVDSEPQLMDVPYESAMRLRPFGQGDELILPRPGERRGDRPESSSMGLQSDYIPTFSPTSAPPETVTSPP